MNKIILLFLLFSLNSKGQNFEKEIDLFSENGEAAVNSVFHNDAIYITAGGFCNSISCMSVVKMDLSGDFLWIRTFNWTDSANEDGMVIRNDSIFISTHDSWSDNDWNYHYLLLNTDGDSLNHFTYNYDNNSFSQLANDGLLLDGNEITMYGSVRNTDTTIVGVLHKINIEGDLITKKFVTINDDNYNYVKELRKYDEEIYAFVRRKVFGPEDQRYIVKVNENLDFELLWESEENRLLNSTSDEMNITPEGNFVFVDIIDAFGHNINIKCLSPDFSELWTYYFPVSTTNGWPQQNVIDLEVTSDDKVVGCGNIIYESNLTGELERAAYIFLLSKDGELIWDHYYSGYDYENGFHYSSSLIDIKPLPDGSYMAVGRIDKSEGVRNGWIIRVDENGCLLQEQCEGQEHWLTSVVDDEVINYSKLVYPNPVINQIHLNKHIPNNSSYNIYNIQGALVKSGQISMTRVIDSYDLDAGIYFINIYDKRYSTSSKFIKLE